MKTRKRFIFTAALLCAVLASCAQKYTAEKDFEVSPVAGGKSVQITKYIGTEWTVNIPPKIRKLPVTHIGNEAFMEKQLIGVTMPDSVVSIGDWAFANNQLTSVIIGNGVTAIGEMAFAENPLTSITIGANVRLTTDTIINRDMYYANASFDSGFVTAYNNGGRQADTYTRPDAYSRTWMSAAYARRERLSIYNRSYYTPPSIIEKFENEYNVRVIVDEYASNEEMYTKLKTGGANYDLVFPSQDYVSIMIRQGMLEPIEKSLIPNLGNIDPAVLQKTVSDPNMQYSVPYHWGAAGIIVNIARVPNYEKSWSIFGRSDLRGRMTMLDDMREVMGGALANLGYSVNTIIPAEIEAAKNHINSRWKPNLAKFDADAYGRGYANGEFWVVQGHAEVVFREIADNAQLMRSTVFFIPPQGGPGYIDSMCIPKGARQKELAHKYIDFIHRPEIYAEFCDFFGLPATVNVTARQFINGPTWYQPQDIANTELKNDLGDALDLYNDAWFNSIRSGN